MRSALPCKDCNPQNDCCCDNGQSSNADRAFLDLIISHATLRVPLRAHGGILDKRCSDPVVGDTTARPEEGLSVLYLDLGIVTILIVINGLLAMSELAIVSSRPARLAGLVAKGVKGSRRALALASDPGKFLSTVQIGITLIGVLSGAFSGATLGLRLASWLIEAGLSPAVAETIGVGVVVTVITYASLIIGELVPKQIALRDPEAVAAKVAPAMVLLAKISLPLVCLLDRSGKALLWLLGHRGEAEEKVSEDEIRSLVVEAENAGVLEPGEKEMIASVMRLGDLPVGAVMTPRHEVSMIDLADPAPTIYRNLRSSDHSCFAVFEGGREHALGIVQAKDILDVYLSGHKPNIRKLISGGSCHS